MSAIVFLLVAVVASLIGSAILVLRHRQPTGVEYSIEEFRREMRALSPDDDRARGR